MTLKEFFRRMKQYNMHRVFILVNADTTATDGSVLPDIINLMENNNNQNLKQEVVKDSILHMKQWGGEYDVENLQ